MHSIGGVKLTREQAKNLIRSRARVSANVIYSPHAIDRMLERDITREDVQKVLIDGDAAEISRAEGGDWKVLTTRKIAGVRVGVVTIILTEDGLGRSYVSHAVAGAGI